MHRRRSCGWLCCGATTTAAASVTEVQMIMSTWLRSMRAWPVYPDDQPDYRETQFGEHGLLSFRVDDNAELLIIVNILWTG